MKQSPAVKRQQIKMRLCARDCKGTGRYIPCMSKCLKKPTGKKQYHSYFG